MDARRGVCGRPVARVATIALFAVGLIAASASNACVATVVARTRTAKGIAHQHPIAVDARLGRVFVADGSHSAASVSELDAASGHLLRTIPVSGTPVAVAVDDRSGHVFVACWGGKGVEGPGSVSTLDAARGRVLRTTAVGVAPGTMVVDERANRVFVLNGVMCLPKHWAA